MLVILPHFWYHYLRKQYLDFFNENTIKVNENSFENSDLKKIEKFADMQLHAYV